jgi:ankyrin repeat protein
MMLCSAIKFGMVLSLAVGIALAGQAPEPASAQSAEAMFAAIRANQLDELKRLANAGGATSKDKLQTTPLHYAALYGNAASMKILLDAGADPDAVDNRGATPLVYAAYSFEKTKLLVDHGAHVQAAAKNGVTPLDVAAVVHGNSPTVRYLLDHGAEITKPDTKTTKRESYVLTDAAERGDPETIKLLLAHGGDVTVLDGFGQTPLMSAVSGDPLSQCEEKTDLLLPGSNVNSVNTFAGRVKNGPISLTHMSALMFAAPFCGPAVVTRLVKAGANVNEKDVKQITALMRAVATDNANPATVKALLDAGAEVNAKDYTGETALDWARKYGNPEIDRMLVAAGGAHGDPNPAPSRPADYQPTTAQALQHSADLLSKTMERFWPAGGGCVACHAQPLTARAYVAMRDAGMNPPETMKKTFTDGMVTVKPLSLNTAPFLLTLGGDYDSILTELDAMAEMNAPPNQTTDVMLHYLATRQERTGEWARFSIDVRPPLQQSSISRTASVLRALKVYSWPARQAEFSERMALAKHWLLESKPETNYEKADRLLGLYYAGATESDLHEAARVLIAARQPDGGWSQTRYLSSDAYATGQALYALRVTGQMKVADPIYKAGIDYLLKTQMPDGSWFVRSRAMKLQPYFQSGFPYDHDQWISTAATAWAVSAIAPLGSTVQARLQEPMQ